MAERPGGQAAQRLQPDAAAGQPLDLRSGWPAGQPDQQALQSLDEGMSTQRGLVQQDIRALLARLVQAGLRISTQQNAST